MTDSDFILTNRTCAIAITADMSFKTALAADFKREYKNIEFLWKQRPGIGGVAALPPAASRVPRKYFCFLATRATEKRHVDPENLVLSLTRLRETSLWKGRVKELSLPVNNPCSIQTKIKTCGKNLFEDCNKKQSEEKERLRREYKQRSERLALTTAVEKVIPTRNIPRGQSPMELLTPR